MKFSHFATLILASALLLASCGDSDADTTNSVTTDVTTDAVTDPVTENFITDEVTEDISVSTDAEEVFSSFDSDEYKKMIAEVYGRPIPTGSTEIRNINDLAFMCSLSAMHGDVGPIGIVPAEFTSDGEVSDVYFITLGGTEFKDGQATDMQTDILAGFGKSNDYQKAIIDTINANIPQGSKIFITGLSLGGMVAQQVISDPDVCNNYEIVNTMCIGSPLIVNEKSECREGNVVRIEDKSDYVPRLSIYSLNFTMMSKYSSEVISETSVYKQPIYAHTFSYVNSPVWQKYDVAGDENGNSTLRFDADNIIYYDAPTQ